MNTINTVRDYDGLGRALARVLELERLDSRLKVLGLELALECFLDWEDRRAVVEEQERPLIELTRAGVIAVERREGTTSSVVWILPGIGEDLQEGGLDAND